MVSRKFSGLELAFFTTSSKCSRNFLDLLHFCGQKVNLNSLFHGPICSHYARPSSFPSRHCSVQISLGWSKPREIVHLLSGGGLPTTLECLDFLKTILLASLVWAWTSIVLSLLSLIDWWCLQRHNVSLMYIPMYLPSCASGFCPSSPSSPADRCVEPDYFMMWVHRVNEHNLQLL